MGALQESAYAKINLALHVRRRRDDGYHELETLFAFVDGVADNLTAKPSVGDRLRVTGEFADGLAGDDNLIMRALAALPRETGWSVTLKKNLPVAAGLGGGSADAGAIFRMVRDAQGLPEDWAATARCLGADVPACVESQTMVGRGVGEELAPPSNPDFARGVKVLLVNPRLPLSTASVFKNWDGVDRGALPDMRTHYQLEANSRNDLEAPAIALCPVIADVLAALRETNPLLARMSGSGATCFALYTFNEDWLAAEAHLRKSRPDWWVKGGWLR